MIRQAFAAAAVLLSLAAASAQAGQVLPSSFEADRVFVIPHVAGGQALKLYVDSGGAFFLLPDAAKRLRLIPKPATDPELLAEVGPGVTVADFPAFAPGEATPSPGARPVMIAPAAAAGIPGWPAQGDGLVGEAWLGGHVWTWDYPGRKFILEDALWTAPRGARAVPVTFKTDAKGARDNNFARVIARIDGADVPLLLDTGAETFLSPAALATVGDGQPAMRATSMIVKSQFDAWHARHPDWRVIDDAQVTTHSRMIEVPGLELAGSTVGPVWFTERPDRNFHAGMSSMMSGQVEGALGGNALGHFRMTIDYPKGQAWFVCVKACSART